MTNPFVRTAVFSAALLLGTAGISAYAASVTVGSGGVNANTTESTTGNGGDVNVGFGNGPLATVDSNGNPVAGGSQSNGNVNLGSLLAGIDLGGPGDGGAAGAGTNGGGGRAILASLSASDRALLKIRCRNVMADPTVYKSEVVNLCHRVAKM